MAFHASGLSTKKKVRKPKIPEAEGPEEELPPVVIPLAEPAAPEATHESTPVQEDAAAQEPPHVEEGLKAEAPSPLDNTGPNPPDADREPLVVTPAALGQAPPAPQPPVETHSDYYSREEVRSERMMWAAAVIVSWAVTIVVVLRVFKIL